MISWTCIADGSPLDAATGELICPACAARYRVADGIPLFAPSPAGPSAILGEIAEHAAGGSIEQAAGDVCRRRDLLRNRCTTDWDFFLPVSGAQRVVHVGPGFGDRTLAVSRASREVIALSPHAAQAAALRAHAREQGADNVHAAVLGSLQRLPLPDASVDVIALDAPGVAAFGVSGAGIAAIVAEFRRVLAPGGTVMLGADNRLFRLPGLDRLRPGNPRPTLDDALATEAGGVRTRLPLRPALRALARGGFQPPNLLAPLPRREDISIVLPVRETAVLRYFFDRLFRRNSPVTRAGLALAGLAARLDLIWWVVPDYFVVAQLGPAQSQSADRT